ncbi:MAG: sigma-70 family RNA polymerase sigma factor [Lachnospiraceae bacterium]|nr:sigma-70 family RNA polymerase sigma factor [Lachnospiraceae bacterium]
MHIFSCKKGEKNKDIKKDLIEQIILEKYNQYYRLAYSYVHSETDAFDIVQNGVYKALRGSSTLKNPAYAETWVYRIMLNECFRYLKQPRNDSYEVMQSRTGMELSYTEDNCDRIDLGRALDSLPEQDKAVVILRFFEDRKLEEIADILEENVSTVKSRLYRSMKKLRSVLGDNV